jgi:anti-sigma regulatory factor (Ser/Thr protein kinase)
VSCSRACQRVQRRLVRDFDAGAEARRELERLGPGLDETDAEIVALLMTELVANSVKHAGPHAGDHLLLDLTLTPDRVRVEVRDGGPGFVPRRRRSSDDISLHWGLELVRRLSDRWQVVPGNGSGETSVWFELDRGVARFREELDGYR